MIVLENDYELTYQKYDNGGEWLRRRHDQTAPSSLLQYRKCSQAPTVAAALVISAASLRSSVGAGGKEEESLPAPHDQGVELSLIHI